MTNRRKVFVTGGTGYIGKALILALVDRGHSICALVRPGRPHMFPPQVTEVTGNALDSKSFEALIPPADTLIHLVGASHPNPFKANAFRNVDLRSIQESVQAARNFGVHHLVYVSVAHPAPIMEAFITAREEGEAAVIASGLSATILRPWYILGPGHRWPYLLLPFYAFAEKLPRWRESARRLGLVTLRQMVAALVVATENPSAGIRIVEVLKIREAANELEIHRTHS